MGNVIINKYTKMVIAFIMAVVTIAAGAFSLEKPDEAYAAKRKVALKKISINHSYIEMVEGKTKKLTVKLKPKNTTVKKKVVWKSSKPGIASVKNGKITAKKAGKTVITAKMGKKKAKCVVYVEAKNGFVNVDQAYKLLNEFRTSSGVWMWGPDDAAKLYFNKFGYKTLYPLERDAALEQTAKIRAKEIVKQFSHYRPDGTLCFSAYPNNLYFAGENIAYGQPTCASAIEAWKETNCNYDGQGHRRNMLEEEFNAVGIAGYRKDGRVYWVQAFGSTF